jgi:hydrogenase maturation protein HypF
VNETATLIRVRGLVQGVGFRPTMWRLAQRHGLRGWVANDGQGVRIHVCGPAAAVEEFVLDLPGESPPLARIDRIEREPAAALPLDAGFHIAGSTASAVGTGVAPDAATCAACVQEIFDPCARRYRYPFTNCTHCGPRLSILRQVPYDRAHTSMAAFGMCADCAAEYHDPADRRFHAQPIACHACGPKLVLVRGDGRPLTLESLSTLDAADAAGTLLQRGHIVAIQGLGGYQLACDATQADVVARLRQLKRRERKPFALMARDLAVIRRHAQVSDQEAALLAGAAAPIVLLQRRGSAAAAAGDAAPDGTPAIAAAVAPALDALGFMLPNTPLHHLMLKRMSRPIVLTSGNLSDEPQAIDAADARRRLGASSPAVSGCCAAPAATRPQRCRCRRVLRRRRPSSASAASSRTPFACCATARPCYRPTWATCRTRAPARISGWLSPTSAAFSISNRKRWPAICIRTIHPRAWHVSRPAPRVCRSSPSSIITRTSPPVWRTTACPSTPRP